MFKEIYEIDERNEKIRSLNHLPFNKDQFSSRQWYETVGRHAKVTSVRKRQAIIYKAAGEVAF